MALQVLEEGLVGKSARLLAGCNESLGSSASMDRKTSAVTIERGSCSFSFIAAVLFFFYVIAGTLICMLVFTNREGTMCLKRPYWGKNTE